MENELKNRTAFYEELVPSIYQSAFPCDFALRPTDWILATSEVGLSVQTTITKETFRALATLDIELVSNQIVDYARQGRVNLGQHYPCGLKCPGCFSEESIFGDSSHLLYWQEVMQVIDAARSIGLRSVKFLGPGELFQNPDLFSILDACEQRKLPISIFTKGVELGDDEHAKIVFANQGISTAQELAKRVLEYDCVRILLGFNSFFPHRQNAMVGSTSRSTTYKLVDGSFKNRGISDYTSKRDNALKILCELNLNSPTLGQRLTLVMAPLLKNQLDEVATIYEWAARRNIPLIIAPSMESGPKAQNLVQLSRRRDPEQSWIKEAYLRVYKTALRTGISSLSELEQYGVSAYIGAEGCNQVANGLMLRLNGQVKICPGSSRPQHIYGSVWSENSTFEPERFIEIWEHCPNQRHKGIENNWCPAKLTSLPQSLQGEVLEELCKFGSGNGKKLPRVHCG